MAIHDIMYEEKSEGLSSEKRRREKYPSVSLICLLHFDSGPCHLWA